MPWKPSDAKRHTKKARTAKKKRQWAHIANKSLARGEPESTAIAKASGTIKRGKKRSKRSKSKSR